MSVCLCIYRTFQNPSYEQFPTSSSKPKVHFTSILIVLLKKNRPLFLKKKLQLLITIARRCTGVSPPKRQNSDKYDDVDKEILLVYFKEIPLAKADCRHENVPLPMESP